MTAHVAFPSLDPTGAPATRSRAILGALREGKGFDGLIVTDALIMEGATAGVSEAEGVVEAIAAGVDILLYPHDVVAVVAALDAAASTGRLPAARVGDALARYGLALTQVSRPVGSAAPAPEAARSMADRLLAHGLTGAALAPLRTPVELVVVDDDLGGPYAPSPSDWVERALTGEGLTGRGGSRVGLVFAEPRAWKGRAGLGAASLAQLDELRDADLIVLFGHPRLAAELPGGVPVLVAWHRQRLMQEAVARWISRRSPRGAARRG